MTEARISEPFARAGDDHDWLVIGSGYGGGVAASRLARAGFSVTVLERGREVRPGEYPETGPEAAAEISVTLGESGETVGALSGLFDLRMGRDVNVLVGNGLGGTSLINANVALEPDDTAMRHWPAVYREPGALSPYFERAREMLGSTPYPDGRTLPKLEALKAVAAGLDRPFHRVPVNVSFEEGVNMAGEPMRACIDCGNCVSGCNARAKNTVLVTYLADARRRGARLYVGAEVRRIARAEDGGWRVTVRDMDDGRDRTLRARRVILAAGALGSTEILSRSRDDPDAPLNLSPALGERFSGNGDAWTFGYNADLSGRDADRPPVYPVGRSDAVGDGPWAAPGPCITGMIDMRADGGSGGDTILEEGVMPGAFATAYAAAFPAMAALMGDPARYGDLGTRLTDAAALGDMLSRHPERLAASVYSGPVSRTLAFLVMGEDAANGRLEMHADRVRVAWPGGGDDPSLKRGARMVRDACDVARAEFLPMPFWQDAFGRRTLTVHPLGGCAMAESAETGVVDPDCRVFRGDGGVHEGLYVCDGAVVPGPTVTNPHLTITAVAERAVDRMVAAAGGRIDLSPTPPDDTAPEPAESVRALLLDLLDEAINGLAALVAHAETDRRGRYAARLTMAWRRLGQMLDPVPVASQHRLMWKLAKRRRRPIAVDLLTQALGILRPMRGALAEGDLAAAVAHVEAALGDISPPVSFPERMTGHLSTLAAGDDPPSADAFRLACHGPVNATLERCEIAAPSVRRAVEAPWEARITNGVLKAEALGGQYRITGRFGYLVPIADEVDARAMRYDGTLTAEPGTTGPRTLIFEGMKRVQYRANAHWWRDLTELFTTIRDGDRVVARGVLTVGLEDLVTQNRDLTVRYETTEMRAAWARVCAAFGAARPEALPGVMRDPAVRADAVKGALRAWRARRACAADKLADHYRGRIFARMGEVVFRGYGGIYSYMANFHARDAGDALPVPKGLPPAEIHHPRVGDGFLKLTRFRGSRRPRKGPVVLAGGFGTKAISFAMPTLDDTLVHQLVTAEYDVWLFDYRGSGEIASSLEPFTLDDVARKDWPAALDLIERVTGRGDIRAVVHCIGSMTLFMAILAGERRITGMIASQLAAHPVTNWFNYAKSDLGIAQAVAHGVPEPMMGIVRALGLGSDAEEIARRGLRVIDPRSPGPLDPGQVFGATLDGALYGVPSFSPVACQSPTCHRINAIFGPSYLHDQLDSRTHDAIRHVFGPVSTTPFVHIARIFGTGHLVDASGADTYSGGVANLAFPIHFIAGAQNAEMLPEATLRTMAWLIDRNGQGGGPPRYGRTVFQGYGHMDCFIGRRAARDIHPSLVRILDGF
ncbi:GMC family oxidoreductase N-terminal domain-containing protein [Litorisediminicola beolgyonensis]|uniref:Cholesterol oxidase n=1 Tax=Litorisediminicola beolgyonensis TaxID=1173614 RepID=A0ABW3ZK60_9RHOB